MNEHPSPGRAGRHKMSKYKWSVTGRDPWTMRPKAIIVIAESKEDAISIGLKKIDTNEFMECRLIGEVRK
jgi:hypothetical protein